MDKYTRKRVTVGELVEILSKLDQTKRIVTPGYEGGYQDLKEDIHLVPLLLNYNSSSYLGPHEFYADADEDLTKYHQEPCYILE